MNQIILYIFLHFSTQTTVQLFQKWQYMKGLWARLSLQVFDSSLEIGEQKMLSYRLNMPLKKKILVQLQSEIISLTQALLVSLSYLQ